MHKLKNTQVVGNQSEKENSTNFSSYVEITITAVIVLLVVSLVAVIVLILKLKKERKIRRELKLAGLYHFQHGDLKRFNPQLGIGEQAELLPYNNNFEFPFDKVKLGKQLGSGAFGVVVQADAYGIIPNEKKTVVAVKMVKDPTDNVQIKALISELKIMVYLGQHLNVVNLLGACTKNIINRELLVIVEYCPFGNLYDFLLTNRPNYIDQVNSATGNIYYSLGHEDDDKVVYISNDDSPRSSGSSTSYKTDNSNSRTNSRGDYEKSSKPLFTKDLISWSFQVACGMEYLSSKKVIHGDLAARNILLAENNIAKICDFGLAKRLYQNSNYTKKKNSLLPIKWMAIEAIRDRVFSTESDVWSYGILLWEIFSLAQAPYPGIEADERLYHKLMEGYKMESPPYAPKEIYKIMCECWEINSELRPPFHKLVCSVGLMLEENIRQHYINLNDRYFIMNTERLNKDQKDYLAILGISDNYINRSFQIDSASIVSAANSDKIPTYLTVGQDLEIPDDKKICTDMESTNL